MGLTIVCAQLSLGHTACSMSGTFWWFTGKGEITWPLIFQVEMNCLNYHFLSRTVRVNNKVGLCWRVAWQGTWSTSESSQDLDEKYGAILCSKFHYVQQGLVQHKKNCILIHHQYYSAWTEPWRTGSRVTPSTPPSHLRIFTRGLNRSWYTCNM